MTTSGTNKAITYSGIISNHFLKNWLNTPTHHKSLESILKNIHINTYVSYVKQTTTCYNQKVFTNTHNLFMLIYFQIYNNCLLRLHLFRMFSCMWVIKSTVVVVYQFSGQIIVLLFFLYIISNSNSMVDRTTLSGITIIHWVACSLTFSLLIVRP